METVHLFAFKTAWAVICFPIQWGPRPSRTAFDAAGSPPLEAGFSEFLFAVDR